jgi:hypothetical protein
LSFGIITIDEDGHASGALSGLDITPTVTDHEAGNEVQLSVASGIQQEARGGLTAETVVRVIVVTGTDLVQRELRPQGRMHHLNRFTRLRAARDIRLIGDHD